MTTPEFVASVQLLAPVNTFTVDQTQSAWHKTGIQKEWTGHTPRPVTPRPPSSSYSKACPYTS